MTMATGRLVDDYLDRLETELRDVPGSRRRELVDEIRGHIAAAQAELEPGDEAGLRTVLDRLGDPAVIAAEARERGHEPRRGRGLEIAALVVLLLGGAIIPIIGWLAGVALLWASSVWTTRDKLIGTLVPPGGLGVALLLLVTVGVSSESCSGTLDVGTGRSIEHCTGGPSTIEVIFRSALLAFFLLGPFVTTAYLARRMRQAA